VTIHFICRGNTHRSVIAEAYLKSLRLKNVEVLSSGTVAARDRAKNEPYIPQIIAHLDTYGMGKFAKTRPDQLTQERVNGSDVVICMNQVVADECMQLVVMPDNVLVWDITDVGEGERVLNAGEDEFRYFDEVYAEIIQEVNELVGAKGSLAS
jgi:protein-tyrosine-phosphatase